MFEILSTYLNTLVAENFFSIPTQKKSKNSSKMAESIDKLVLKKKIKAKK